MKGAVLLSKDVDFFDKFSQYLTQSGYECIGASNSVKLLTDDKKIYLLFRNRGEGSLCFEKHEMPERAKSLGYCFSFLVDCRSEVLFCRIVGGAIDLDMLICDSNGSLYTPSELSVSTLAL